MNYNQETFNKLSLELEAKGYEIKKGHYKNESFGYWKSFGMLNDYNSTEICKYQIAILVYDYSNIPDQLSEFPISVSYEFIIGGRHVLDKATASISDSKMNIKWFEVFCTELYDKLFEGILFEQYKFEKWEAEELLKKINMALGIDIRIKNRKRLYVYSRYIFFHKIKKQSTLSLAEIAEITNQDHSTVIYGLNEYKKLKLYPDFNKIRDKINAFLMDDNNGTFLV